MKFSQYNYASECREGIVLVNTYLSKYVKFTNNEDIEHFSKLYSFELPLSSEDKMVQSLYEQGYILDDDIDEYKKAKDDIDKCIAKKDKKLEIVLYVTDQCNFRCVYCPVKYENENFSDENWNALYKHVENSIKSNKYSTIDMSFFGGEPLLEINKILSFLEKLNTLSKEYPNIYFEHEITTNGYFLTPEIYDKLVEYNVVYYQITVDGFAETHNKMRPLIGGKGTWEKIIENLEYINTRNDNAQILLRANYNKTNIDSLEKYKKWQKEKFNNPKFKFTYYPVTNFSENVPEEQLFEKHTEEAYQAEKNITNFMQTFKKYSFCHCANKHSYTISVDGNISKCDNLHGDRSNIYIGKLAPNGDFIFNKDINVWREGYELEECEECLAYPICCARICPLKKVHFEDLRPDCQEFKKHWKHKVDYYLKNII